LNKISGVEGIRVNVPLKQVLVDHDSVRCTARDVETALAPFGARILRDGAASLTNNINASEKSGAAIGRSQFHVQNICCASEIPAITAIVQPLPGVANLAINPTTKTVYVDHDCSLLSATDICNALNAQSFGAQVRVDGAARLGAASPSTLFVTSTLRLHIGEADNDTFNENVQAFFLGFVDVSQVEAFVLDIPSKSIQVKHNPFCLTAQELVQFLAERSSLRATISLDGADPAVWDYPEQLRALHDKESLMENANSAEGFKYPRPTVMISGLLWIVSMLSLIGGNWYVTRIRMIK
jgi:copper chaperone CopZ